MHKLIYIIYESQNLSIDHNIFVSANVLHPSTPVHTSCCLGYISVAYKKNRYSNTIIDLGSINENALKIRYKIIILRFYYLKHIYSSNSLHKQTHKDKQNFINYYCTSKIDTIPPCANIKK